MRQKNVRNRRNKSPALLKFDFGPSLFLSSILFFPGRQSETTQAKKVLHLLDNGQVFHVPKVRDQTALNIKARPQCCFETFCKKCMKMSAGEFVKKKPTTIGGRRIIGSDLLSLLTALFHHNLPSRQLVRLLTVEINDSFRL